jgi:crossover junction endodeoxyribonuclease RusA
MISFTVPGKPIPAQRMTQRSKWSARARRSLDYQEHVATVATLHVKDRPLPWRYVATTLRFYLMVRKDGHLPGNRLDIDNACKSVLDGCQYANIFANDRCVVEAHLFVLPCQTAAEERVEITITEFHHPKGV